MNFNSHICCCTVGIESFLGGNLSIYFEYLCFFRNNISDNPSNSCVDSTHTDTED